MLFGYCTPVFVVSAYKNNKKRAYYKKHLFQSTEDDVEKERRSEFCAAQHFFVG